MSSDPLSHVASWLAPGVDFDTNQSIPADTIGLPGSGVFLTDVELPNDVARHSRTIMCARAPVPKRTA